MVFKSNSSRLLLVLYMHKNFLTTPQQLGNVVNNLVNNNFLATILRLRCMMRS